MTYGPFHINGPAIISNSGGRTSAYMLWRILHAHDGKLPPDVHVCFTNTGREMPSTLDFLREQQAHWNVPIRWLEYRRDPDTGHVSTEEVLHNSASRDGEPFEAMLSAKKRLPNPVTRFCTVELKIRTLYRWVRAELGWEHWTNHVGLRWDEPTRIARLVLRNAESKERFNAHAPLNEAQCTIKHVREFWASQPFDLQSAGGWEGNCDGCFLKREAAIARMFRDHPERMAWWPKMEQDCCAHGTIDPSVALFRKDRPSYSEIARVEYDQGRLNLAVTDDGADIFVPCDIGCGA